MSSKKSRTSSFSFVPASRVSNFGPTVWHEFSPLANKYDAINLGQGFPNFEPPRFVMEAGLTSMQQPSLMHQYTRSGGHPRLVKALSTVFSPLFNRQIDPMTEICIGVGASETIYAIIQAIVNPGDEVIFIEPFFDIYHGAVEMAGGITKVVSLKPSSQNLPTSSDWKLDMKELEGVLTSKSRLIILNNPHNPTGKVFSKQELEQFARVVEKYPHLIVLSDEVYEQMVFDNQNLVRFGALPGMFERTLTVGSAGKTFSVTGWKVGWVIGPQNMISAIMAAHQYIPFSVVTPLQEAVAIGMEESLKNNYFEEVRNMYEQKRDRLVKALKDCGLNPIVPQGSYFVIADTSSIQITGNMGKEKSITGMNLDRRGWNMCRWLTTEIGVAAIPLSAFCTKENVDIYDKYVRFCFCKTDEVLDEAAQRFQKLKSILQQQ